LAEPPFQARAAALAETVALVRGLWGGAPVTLQGAHVRATDARLATRPVQTPHVPLLIAGGGERVTLRQVAAHADMCNFGPSDAYGSAWGLPEIRRKLAALRRHCAAVGRPYGAILRSHLGSAAAAETEAALDAKLAARPGQAALVEAPREPGLPRRLAGHYRVPSVEHAAYVNVAGTPAQLVAYYQGLVDAGMRYFILGSGTDAETLRLLADAVIPRLTIPECRNDSSDGER
jgi:alkanesulfonate monooxygenase SsuD/methylene tetrahydromethanopterin reductase-like flavin-dependent oxidoreductase (luciferase family)